VSVKDRIKIHQLIRERIDVDAFETWYADLSIGDQQSLIKTLFLFAYRAGVTDATWEQAGSLGGFAGRATLIDRIKSFHLTEIGLHDWIGFDSWLGGLSSHDKHATFLVSVYLFGVAEGNVFRNETVASCNHWWHRDLLDPRVVDDIITDPEYYRTSMKQDASIKNRFIPEAVAANTKT
jgi:uncharacterized protein DUF5958